jgi:hypothetical protein
MGSILVQPDCEKLKTKFVFSEGYLLAQVIQEGHSLWLLMVVTADS